MGSDLTGYRLRKYWLHASKIDIPGSTSTRVPLKLNQTVSLLVFAMRSDSRQASSMDFPGSAKYSSGVLSMVSVVLLVA
jgi:hypothetical protein